MYLCGFLPLDLGICAQDLNKLGDVELEALQGMAAVFAGQAGDGAPGSRIAVEKRLVPSRSISRGRPFGGPISKASCSFFVPFIYEFKGRKIGNSGAKVPLRALVGNRGESKGPCFSRDSKVPKRKIGRESMLRWESGGFVFHLDEFEGLISAMQKTIILLLC